MTTPLIPSNPKDFFDLKLLGGNDTTKYRSNISNKIVDVTVSEAGTSKTKASSAHLGSGRSRFPGSHTASSHGALT